MTNKYSTIFESKLPAFIRDDPSYSRFVQFFDAYYAWFDETYDIYGFGEKLDIDYGFSEFYAYYKEDFLPYFPDIDTIATDKIKLLKIVKELYKAKGIPDSFKFLFRALYNTEVEVTPTKDFVLKPSDGKWIVPKSIKIKSLDPAFLNIQNLRLLGETSKSIGTVEKSKISGKFTQIYLSNIERVFNSAETVTVIDYDGDKAYFVDGVYTQYDKTKSIPTGAVSLSSKIIGSLSNIDVNSDRRGKYYKVNDPVVLTGGFVDLAQNPVGAKAYISEVTSGRIQKVLITKGGYGYTQAPNSYINVVKADGTLDTPQNVQCNISFVDQSNPAQVSYITNDCVEDNLYVTLGASHFDFPIKPTANANNSQLKEIFGFVEYSTYPVVSVSVVKGGGGYEAPPTLEFKSTFKANTYLQYEQNLGEFGILAPIDIVNGGGDYSPSDTLTISGGDGSFAFARITSLSSNGAITGVEYYYNSSYPYSVGGMGYNISNLPTVTINTSTGANAVLQVPGVLGYGVEYEIETDKIGAITKISLSENGEDYIAAPNVSLRVQDIVVTESIILNNANFDNCIVYQGSYSTPSFIANVDSIQTLSFDSISNYQLFSLRIYNYRGNIDPSNPIYLHDTTDTDNESVLTELTLQSNYTDSKYKNGIKVYGDGSAKATAKFLNGLIEDQGRYLNTDGQPSAHSILQNDVYNNSTYILSAEKDYNSYKNTIQNLVHPIGTHIVTRNLLKSNVSYNVSSNSTVSYAKPIDPDTISVSLVQETDSYTSNTIQVVYDTDIDELFKANDIVYIAGDNAVNICSSIASVDVTNGILNLKDRTQYKYPNTYSGYTQANTVIVTKTNNYNQAKYSLAQFVNIGDIIKIGTNSVTVINKINNTLYFTYSLNQTGSSSDEKFISVIKDLTSNNITVYSTV